MRRGLGGRPLRALAAGRSVWAVRSAWAALALALACLAAGPAAAAPGEGDSLFPVQRPLTGAERSERRGHAESYGLAALSRVSREWGSGVPAILEEAFRRCFRTYVVDGRLVTLRIPFAENNERSELAGVDLSLSGGGKADPEAQWGEADAFLASGDFASYVAALTDGREKAIIFDLEKRSWTTSSDWFYLARMKSGLYPGMPHKPFVLVKGEAVGISDVYNYLYCVGRIGMDCAGFVWSELKAVAARGGIDLDKAVRRSVGAPKASASALFVGAGYFDPANRDLEEVEDRISNLRPGDVIAFRTDDGEVVHSAIIQSVDLKAGKIRYLQSTDEAPQEQRGVHDSVIEFDPRRPSASLKDPSLLWRQLRASAFLGEAESNWHDDGERYRAHGDKYPSVVVRLRLLRDLILRLGTGVGEP